MALLRFLRRRFAFFDIKPGFNSSGFKIYKDKLNDQKLNRIIELIESLNNEISSDNSLGDGFEIGHSYFCNLNDKNNDLYNIVEYEIIPLLKEYWFDEPNKVREWLLKFRDILK